VSTRGMSSCAQVGAWRVLSAVPSRRFSRENTLSTCRRSQ
jgi:hypothetical protein